MAIEQSIDGVPAGRALHVRHFLHEGKKMIRIITLDRDGKPIAFIDCDFIGTDTLLALLENSMRFLKVETFE